MQIRTTKLQEMMAKAVKGVGNNKLIPLTSLLAIELKDEALTLVTTDSTNYLYVRDMVEGATEPFYAVVQADLFAKLVSRITSDTITLDIVNGNLEITGNGVYTIAVVLDDSTGEMLQYPNPVAKNFDKELGVLTPDVIKAILTALKPALATTMEMPQYTNYYVGENGVMATDTFKIGYMAADKVFVEPTLVSHELMDLLEVLLDDGMVHVTSSEDHKLLFAGDYNKVYGPAMPGIADYQVEAIKKYIDQEYPHCCRVSKVELLQLIDRLSLFVNETVDDGMVQIAFTNDGLQMLSQQSSGVETLPYVEYDGGEEVVSSINLEMLRTQVKAQTGDLAVIWFGDDKSIKLTDDNNSVTAVISLVQ